MVNTRRLWKVQHRKLSSNTFVSRQDKAGQKYNITQQIHLVKKLLN